MVDVVLLRMPKSHFGNPKNNVETGRYTINHQLYCGEIPDYNCRHFWLEVESRKRRYEFVT